MKYKPLVTLLFITSSLCGCNSQTRKREEPVDPEDVNINTVDELTDDKLSLFPIVFEKKLSGFSCYKSVTKGQTVTNAIFIKVNQSIDTVAIKGDYSYLLNESHSNMHNVVHTAYYHNQQAVCKDNDGQYKNITLEDYSTTYGIYPFENSIEGYSLKDGSIKNVVREESETDYTFKVTFDRFKSTNNVKIQMKRFGALDDYPAFTKDTVMSITVKNDFTPVSLKLTASYKAKKIMEVDCSQTYTVTYSNFNEEIEVPGLNDVIDLFK